MSMHPQTVPRARVIAHIEECTDYKPFPDLVDLAFCAINYLLAGRHQRLSEEQIRARIYTLPQYNQVRTTFGGCESCTVGEVLDSLKLESLCTSAKTK
jgi:hypothetical protein